MMNEQIIMLETITSNPEDEDDGMARLYAIEGEIGVLKDEESGLFTAQVEGRQEFICCSDEFEHLGYARRIHKLIERVSG